MRFSTLLVVVALGAGCHTIQEELPTAPGKVNGLTNLLPMDRTSIWFCGSQVGRAGEVEWPAGVHAFRHVRDLLARLDAPSA